MASIGRLLGGESQPFGLDLHEDSMKILWGWVINIGIFLALYRNRKLAILGHSLIGLAATVATISSSLMILSDMSIPVKNLGKKDVRGHMIFGIALLGLLFIQALLGIFGRLLNCCGVGSIPIYYINKTHRVLGWILVILCKAQNFYIRSIKLKWYLFLAFDILTFSLIIIRKFTFEKMERAIEPQYQDSGIKKITTMKELENTKDYCIFSNFIYDLAPLKMHHPAGYQILELTKNKQIDKFIYGMYPAELLPGLPTNSHNSHSMDLCGDPIAKISIQSPYKGMPQEAFDVTITHMSAITNYSKIYEIYVTPTDKPISYEGYDSLLQIGRFYSLTVNNKVTRLYTAVNFLQPSNKKLLQRLGLIKVGTANLQKQSLSSKISHTEEAMTDRAFSSKGSRDSDSIPLLVKVYQNGTLPNLLIDNKIQNMRMSPPKGFGLSLNQLQRGTIIIIAGGTGLYPFSDLIDLLYKNSLLKSGNMLKNDILKESPILESNPFDKFTFKLYLAIEILSEIHPITLKQISALHGYQNFTATFKIKESFSKDIDMKASLTTKNFLNILENQIQYTKDLSKVWLCGPPKMCESMCQFMEKQNKSNLLHLV